MSAPLPFPKSDHFDGNHFFTPRAPRPAALRDVLKWRLGKNRSRPAPWPKWVEITPRALPPRPAAGSPDIIATWINHSTFLLQTAAANILLDPVFSRCCGPLGKLGPPRAHAPGITLDALPRIDIVCLSHDHYDHCDIPTLRHLARRDAPLGITPLGNGTLLRRAAFAPDRIIELDWWQSCELNIPAPNTNRSGISQSKIENPKSKIHLTPAQHWSNRLTGGRNRRLWGGFFITFPPPSATAGSPARAIYFAGDTGYHATIFRDIAARLGPPDLALLPIGAYEPRWFMSPQHCNPAEAVRIHCDLRSRQSIAMHWGTFQLTDEPRDAPPRALAQALRDANLPPHVFKVLAPGESLTI